MFTVLAARIFLQRCLTCLLTIDHLTHSVLFLVSVSPHLGIYYTMAIIGPAVGYVIGGQLLLVYTDFMHIDALA